MDNSHQDDGALEDMQRFLHAAVHDLLAASRRTGISAELIVQAEDHGARAELAIELKAGLAKTGELLAGISRYGSALAPSRHAAAVFPAASAVRFALAKLEREIREASATVTIGELPEIHADRERIAEVFEQLIGNALKFRGTDPPAIQIEGVRVSGSWHIGVKDNGVGIPKKYRERLFIPFRRLHGSDVPGVGLGLAICRKIVEGYGGNIWIEDAEGTGVTISFALPSRDGDLRA